MTAPIDLILPLLSKVRQRQPGQWSASCTAHEDKSPSLTVRETPGGAVLLHCFGGCSVEAVVASLGLEMSDLFPPRERTGREPKRTPRLLTAGQALELLDTESNLVAITAASVFHGTQLDQADLDRVLVAAGRVAWLRSECMGGQRVEF